jgi:hypothetical protein
VALFAQRLSDSPTSVAVPPEEPLRASLRTERVETAGWRLGTSAADVTQRPTAKCLGRLY